MIFADYQFYTDVYLQGDESLIPEKSFMRWAEKASNRININNIEFDEDEEIPEALKFATVEVAEIMFKDMQSRSMDTRRSMSNQGYSVTFADQTVKPEEIESNIRRVINRRLANGNLHNLFVFRGI